MKKLTAILLALALSLTAVTVLAEELAPVPALSSKTVQDRVVVVAENVVVVPVENPAAVVMAEQLAALPEDKKMDVFPEEVKSIVAAAIAEIPEVEDLSELAPVDTYKLELSDIQPGAKIKLEDAYGEDINVIGYIIEFLPETLALDPVFVKADEELVLPDGVIELVVYAIAKK